MWYSMKKDFHVGIFKMVENYDMLNAIIYKNQDDKG